MAFLIDRFWLPLLLSGLIGIMIGWATCGRAKAGGSWKSSWLPLGILAAIAGVFAAVQMVLPGRYGLWLEVALMMFAAYLAGCCISCLIHGMTFGRQRTTEKSELQPAAGIDADIGSGSTRATSEAAAPARETALSIVSRSADATAVSAAPKPLAAIAPATPGAKPPLLHRPRNGQKDDLTLIWGVAEKLEERMNRMGIWHFDQIAAWTPEHVKWFEHEVEGFRGRLVRDKWIEQCAKLAKGWRPDNKVGIRPKS